MYFYCNTVYYTAKEYISVGERPKKGIRNDQALENRLKQKSISDLDESFEITCLESSFFMRLQCPERLSDLSRPTGSSKRLN